MSQVVSFQYVRSVPLSYNGECGLRAVGPELDFYAEEIYGEEGWMAQYHYSFEGERLAVVDEGYGDNQDAPRMPMQGAVLRPSTGSNIGLNFGGARHRGMMEEDRVQEMVRPLDFFDKMLLVEAGLLPQMPPPNILGLAQSYVSSEVRLVSGMGKEPLFLLSRRLRIAYRMAELMVSEDGEPYDYDSHEIATLQFYYPKQADQPLGDTLLTAAQLSVSLYWPTDIIVRDEHLFVADSTRELSDDVSRVHIWQIEINDG